MLQTNRFVVSGWVVFLAACLGAGCAQGVSDDPAAMDESGGAPSGMAGGAAPDDVPAPAEPEPEQEAMLPAEEDPSALPPADDTALEPSASDAADCADPVMVGPNVAKTVINDPTGGTLGWLTPEVVSGDDDLSASYAGLAASNYLFARDFGLEIPDGARIRGIVVEWQRKALGPGVKDAEVLIVRNGAIGADNHARGDDWPTAANPMWGTYGLDSGAPGGDAADLWGETWSAADLNGQGFGVALSVAAGPAFVSRVRVSVSYCP
jgi:hypothetical protein